MNQFLRFLRVCGAYLASMLAASATLVVIFALLGSGGQDAGSFNEGFFLIFQTIAGYALIPAIVFVAVCEIRQITNLLIYLVFSVLVALSPFLGLVFERGGTVGVLVILPFLLGPGLTAGYVYWRLAGRNAGTSGFWARH